MATPLSRAEGRGSIEVQHLRRLAGAAYCGRALTLGGGFGSSDASGTPTADSARTPSLGCAFCRGRIGVLRLFFVLLVRSRRRSVGAPGAGRSPQR